MQYWLAMPVTRILSPTRCPFKCGPVSRRVRGRKTLRSFAFFSDLEQVSARVVVVVIYDAFGSNENAVDEKEMKPDRKPLRSLLAPAVQHGRICECR